MSDCNQAIQNIQYIWVLNLSTVLQHKLLLQDNSNSHTRKLNKTSSIF